MIKSIELTNFGKHRHLATTFGPGMTALRGANEAGKSTLLRGIAYAMFGTEALPQSLEDTVTWDEEVNTLKVVLKIEVDGVDYTIKRGKSGAELRYEGGSVTGQRDVTRFLCEKMRTDPKVAHYLVLSNQNQIRGALEEGSAKTSQLIEQLARMEELDNIIDMIQSDLPTGNTRAIESVIESAEQTLADAKARSLPDVVALQAHVERAEQAAEAAKQANESAERDAADKKERASALKNQYQRRLDVVSELSAARLKVSRLEQEEAGILESPTRSESEIIAEIERTQEQKANVDAVLRRRSAYEKFNELPSMGYDTMPMEQFEAERNDATDRLAKLSQHIPARRARVSILESNRQHGSCSFCGQDFSDVPEVAKRNQDIDRELGALAKELDDLDKQLAETRDEAGLYSVAADEMAALLLAAGRIDEYVSVDRGVFPPTVTWNGDVPDFGDLPEYDTLLKELRDELKVARQKERDLMEVRAKVRAASEEVSLCTSRLEQAIEVLVQDVEEAEREAAQATEHQKSTSWAYNEALQGFSLARSNLQVAKREVEMHEQAVTQAEDALETQRKVLKDMQFNNQLLKDVRAARPKVADALWNLVLTTVSAYFSEMRGEESVVTKDKGGFKVNGREVPALSGSTLDILGLAMRVALTRTFLPSAPFIVLDEPAAACDEQRTHNMLAFIAGAGVGQVLLSSHDGSSVAVSDAVLELED